MLGAKCRSLAMFAVHYHGLEGHGLDVDVAAQSGLVGLFLQSGRDVMIGNDGDEGELKIFMCSMEYNPCFVTLLFYEN